MVISKSHVLLDGCAAGIIKVTNAATSDLLGYVGRDYISVAPGVFTITDNKYIALLSVTVSQGSRENILENNGPNPGTYPFLGFVGSLSGPNFTMGSSNYATLTSTAATPPNSPPVVVGNAYNAGEPSESAIWTADANFFITAQWVNTDLSLPPTTLFYVSSDLDILYATGDLAKYNSDAPPDQQGVAVVLQVV